MPALQRLAANLVVELQELTAEDGARLHQIIWRLEREIHRSPRDVETSIAYNHALACAGRAQDARREAQRALGLIRERAFMPSIPAFMIMNVAGALCDGGLAEEAEACLEEAHRRPHLLPEEAELMRHHGLGFALRFGELEWFAARLGSAAYLDFIRERGLSAWWPRQQRAIEAAIGDRVASTVFEVVDYFDGTDRIVARYHTDAHGHSEIDRLNDVVLEAVAQAYGEHPDGPGAFLGHVVITVHGPEIPIEELDP